MAIQVNAAMVTSSITRVTATVTAVDVASDPSSVTQDLVYVAATGQFAGTLVVPAGARKLRVDAFAGAQLVGTGSQELTVVAGKTATVSITILDTTGGPPVPDHAPVVTAFSVAQTTASVGDTIAVAASAVDVDGDVVAYAWSVSPPGCGTFANAAAATTSFTAATAATCTVAVTAMAGGKSDSRSAAIAIAVATGSIDVAGLYVPNPVISRVTVGRPGVVEFACARDATDATYHTPLAVGTTYEVTATFTATAGVSMALTSSCGGTIALVSATTARWTPSTAGACLLTSSVVDHGLSDAFPVLVVTQ